MTLAEAVLPLPASVEVTALVTLFCMPVLMPETFTAKLQEPFAASVAPARLTLADPGAAIIVPPPQLPARPLGVETIKPGGNESVKAIPLSDVPVLGLDKVKVKAVVPCNGRLAAPKALAIVGADMGGAAEEPPPQPAECATVKAIVVEHEMKRSFRITFFFLSTLRSTDTRLGHLALHSAAELIERIYSFHAIAQSD